MHIYYCYCAAFLQPSRKGGFVIVQMENTNLGCIYPATALQIASQYTDGLYFIASSKYSVSFNMIMVRFPARVEGFAGHHEVCTSPSAQSITAIRITMEDLYNIVNRDHATCTTTMTATKLGVEPKRTDLFAIPYRSEGGMSVTITTFGA